MRDRDHSLTEGLRLVLVARLGAACGGGGGSDGGPSSGSAFEGAYGFLLR